MYHTYRDIERAVTCGYEFKGNSSYSIRGSQGYEIYSYSTLIYSDEKGLNTDYYSVTTSKLQNIISHAYYGKTIQQLRKECKKQDTTWYNPITIPRT